MTPAAVIRMIEDHTVEINVLAFADDVDGDVLAALEL